MSKKKERFLKFKAHFDRWADRFGLNCYDITYRESKTEERAAYIEINASAKFATVYLCKGKCNYSLKQLALHEAIHLLLGDLTNIAMKRVMTGDELEEAEEAVVNMLTMVVK